MKTYRKRTDSSTHLADSRLCSAVTKTVGVGGSEDSGKESSESSNPRVLCGSTCDAVWAMEGRHSQDPDHHGFLFVRTFMPSITSIVVDVIEGGTSALVPGALDVGTFWSEID